MGTETTKETSRRPVHQQTEAEAIEEEVLETLHPDRAHHDELGHTEESVEDNHPAEAPSSPREQPATPIDIATIDE